MSKIQKRLDELQPYVMGIRYAEGIPFIDVVFKDKWKVPKSNTIKEYINEENSNHYVFFSEVEGVGIDELLDFAENIIKLNVEREKKIEFLKKKGEELQELFKKHSLKELYNLKFVIDEEPFITDNFIDDIMDESEVVDEPEERQIEPPQEPEINEEIPVVEDVTPQTNKPIMHNDIELPPKTGKIELEVHDIPEDLKEGSCNCGPDEACPKCIDEKGL
jgi:hypothetical protein